MPQQQDPLAQLRDIHLPDAVGFWPPAPGWWMLAVLLLGAVIYGIYRWQKFLYCNRYRKPALLQLKAIQSNIEDGSTYLPALNQLLKQTALAAPKARFAAALTGQQWLEFLDRSGNTNTFTNGPGRLLLDGPYSPPQHSNPPQQQLRELHQAAKDWIKRHQLDGVRHVEF